MRENFCYYCFQTLRAKDGKVVRCTSCGKVYHAYHWDEECLHCTATSNKSYRPLLSFPLRSITRKPIRLERRFIQSSENESSSQGSIGELFTQAGIAFRMFIGMLIGIGIATIIGAYTDRLLEYKEFNNLATYVDSIIRDGFPSDEIFYAALIAASMGAFAFFPVQLRNSEGYNSFLRRMTRLIAIIILLIYANIIAFGLNLNIITEFFNNYSNNIAIEALVSSVLIAQIGALSISWFLGFIIRRINSPLSMSKLPKWMQYSFVATRIVWHFIAAILVISLTIFVAIKLLPPYVQDSIILEMGQRTIITDAVQLIIVTAIIIIALLTYYPPRHSGVQKKWWPLRIIGCIACFAYLILAFRSTPVESTEYLLRAILASAVIAISFLPVYRATS